MAGAEPVAESLVLGDGCQSAPWRRCGPGAGQGAVPRPWAAERAGASAADPAAGGDGVSSSLDLRAAGLARQRAVGLVRLHLRLPLDRSGTGGGGDGLSAAGPGDPAGAGGSGPQAGTGGGDAGGLAGCGVPDGHAAPDPARGDCGRGPGLRQGDGRVWRHDHLRRQYPGRDAAIYAFLQLPGGDAAALRLVAISVALAMGALVVSEWLSRRVAARIAGK